MVGKRELSPSLGERSAFIRGAKGDKAEAQDVSYGVKLVVPNSYDLNSLGCL